MHGTRSTGPLVWVMVAVMLTAMMFFTAAIGMHAAGVAAGQEQEDPGEQTETPTPEPDNTDIEQRIDSESVLVESDYSFNQERWTLTIRTERAKTITVMQAGQWEEGSGIGSIERVRINGEETIEVDIPPLNGESQAVIFTQLGIEEERFAYVSSGQKGENPLDQTGPTEAWIGGAATAISMVVLAIRRRLKQGGGPEIAWRQ